MQRISDVMTAELTTCPQDATIEDAARLMQQEDIGDVLVVDDDGRLAGIVTDRDIVVRALAEGRSGDTRVSEVASSDVVTLEPGDAVDRAVKIMRDRAMRRVPVVEEGRPVGIVSIGDLAVERDPDSALADISAAEPNE